ncbi:MAG: asparagine synthase B [Bacteroidales bacterium OttesenSCG-928-I14]|jgi:asparagine synthase (glutamine-hydrolysing)|nr:asparagine synthase B [Bacteroidales bacterium OttesenSCG-928-I14]
MCGIVGVFNLKQSSDKLRPRVLSMVKKIRHRGPDWSGIYCGEKAILAHERLAIVDPQSGRQPLYSTDGKIILAVNGEIYNHSDIRERQIDYEFKTKSDCEVILSLYKEKGVNFLEDLNGIFAFALYDEKNNSYFIARDHIGIIPLYMGWDTDGTFYVASELKSLESYCSKLEVFLPGHYLYSDHFNKYYKLVKWYKRGWMDYKNVKNELLVDDENKSSFLIRKIRESLEKAVKCQLMTDVPYGVLLSGGLDSSIISAIAKKYASKRVEAGNKNEKAWWPQLHSFAVGLRDSPDLISARRVADYIGTVHHEVNFTIQEGLDAIRDVIYHIETYDVTTVRASTPMYLLARVIRSMGIKMVLSGEGADEIFGGYLYFHKAPSAKLLHEEIVRKLSFLHLYDCLRANKSLAAWGIEGRVPFLDKEFIDVAMYLNPENKLSGLKNRIEKWILRKAFEDLLPGNVIWRQKEQFSDGVGYDWINTLKKITNSKITEKQFAQAKIRFPVNTPATKEEYYYRTIFEELFPSKFAAKTVYSVPSIACSTPIALEWDENFKNMIDPSGRSIKTIHNESL